MINLFYSQSKKKCITLALLFAAFIITLVLTFQYQHDFSDFRVVKPSEHAKNISLPYVDRGNGNKKYEFEGKLTRGWFAPNSYNFAPDNRLLGLYVNNQKVDLTGFTVKQLESMHKGVTINLSSQLNSGSNDIKIVLQDYGGDLGLKVFAAPLNIQFSVLVLSWVLIIALFLVCSMSVKRISWARQLAYVLIVLFSILQVVVIFIYNPVEHIWSDAARHWVQGTDLLRMDLMSMTDPILYQLYIAFLAKFTLKNAFLVGYVTSLLATLTPWLWYRFIRELQPNKTIALYCWAFLAFLPSWMSIYSYFMQETLLLPLLGAALWATWRAKRKATLGSFTFMVIIWVLAGLTRGIAIPMAAVCCTWLWFAQDYKLQKALCSIAVFALTLGPLSYRSYYQSGEISPHGMGHLARIYGVSGKQEIIIHSQRDGSKWTHGFGSPSMGAKPFAPVSDWMTQRKGRVVVHINFRNGAKDWSQAKQRVDRPISKRMWILKEDLIFLFFAPSWPDNNADRLLDKVNIAMRWLWAPLFILFLCGLIYFRKDLKSRWMLPSIIIAWFVVQGLLSIAVNEGRYRKPLEGLLVAQFAVFASLAYTRRQRKIQNFTKNNDNVNK